MPAYAWANSTKKMKINKPFPSVTLKGLFYEKGVKANMKKGVISLGEALIDFIPDDKEQLLYTKNPGGAPANVAVGLAKLGTNVTFIGKVGDDLLGKFLKETLKLYHVDITGLTLTNEARTGLTFVSLDETGERSFEFFVNPSADQLLQTCDVQKELFQTKRIFHFGSISLISPSAKQATLQALHYAKENNMYVSYDPNLRLSLWENEHIAEETIQSVLSKVDILKLADSELQFLMGSTDDSAIKSLATQYDIPLIFITMGDKGSMAYCKNGIVHVPSLDVNVVDTTGAGDAYMSGILYHLNGFEKDLRKITLSELKEMLTFATVSGGLATTSKGAISALPKQAEIANYLK